MPEETSTPPTDTQAPPSEPVTPPAAEPPKSEDTSGQATPPPEAAAPAPELESPTQTETPAPEQVSENLTGKQAEVSESVPEPTPAPSSSAQATSPAPQPATASAVAPTSIIGELLTKARAKIQERRKKKLEKIMAKVTETGKISNDEVQKLLRVSDATATRYLDLLEKEGRLRQEGKTGKHVVYIKPPATFEVGQVKLLYLAASTCQHEEEISTLV